MAYMQLPRVIWFHPVLCNCSRGCEVLYSTVCAWEWVDWGGSACFNLHIANLHPSVTSLTYSVSAHPPSLSARAQHGQTVEVEVVTWVPNGAAGFQCGSSAAWGQTAAWRVFFSRWCYGTVVAGHMVNQWISFKGQLVFQNKGIQRGFKQ